MANGQHVGYIRVSSELQNMQRQLDGVSLDRVFEDRASGKDTQRPQLIACLAHVRGGDTLHIHSMDRLARNLDDLRRIVREVTARGVVVQFHKENLVFSGDDSPMANLLLSMLGAVAEFERSLIRERQREGIELAKKAGVYRGRRPALTSDQVEQIRVRSGSGEPKAALAREFRISRETLYAHLRSQ